MQHASRPWGSHSRRGRGPGRTGQRMWKALQVCVKGEYQRRSGDRARTGRKEKRRDVGAPGSKTDVCGLQEQQPEETRRAEGHFIGQWQPVAVQFSDSLSAQARSVRLPHADNSNHLTLMYNAVLGILVCIRHPCRLVRLLSGKNRPSQRSVSRNLFRSSFCF